MENTDKKQDAQDNVNRKFGLCYMCDMPFDILTGKCHYCGEDMGEHYE